MPKKAFVLSPKLLRIVIVLLAATVLAGIIWAARAAGPSHTPSSAHLQAPGSLSTPATDTAGVTDRVEGGTPIAGEMDTSPSQVAPEGAGPGTHADLPAGAERRFGIVVEVREGSPWVLVIDPAQLMPKDEGASAATAELELYNKVIDPTPVSVAEKVRVVSATGTPMTFDDWRTSVTSRTASGMQVAVWVDVDGNTAVRIEEQELP